MRMTSAAIRRDLRELMQLSISFEAIQLLYPQGLPPIRPTGTHSNVRMGEVLAKGIPPRPHPTV